MSKDPGVLVEFRRAIKVVWITLLMNYVINKGFEVIPFADSSGWEQEEEVEFRETTLPDQATVEADAVAQEIMKLQPCAQGATDLDLRVGGSVTPARVPPRESL
jgi:hypothetical protein